MLPSKSSSFCSLELGEQPPGSGISPSLELEEQPPGSGSSPSSNVGGPTRQSIAPEEPLTDRVASALTALMHRIPSEEAREAISAVFAWVRSRAHTSPRSSINWASMVVFPPGAAHMSSTREPGAGVRT